MKHLIVITALFLLIVFIFADLYFSWLSLKQFALLATIIGVAVASIGIIMVYVQIKTRNSIRRMEAITKIYSDFLTDEMNTFLARIRHGDKIRWKQKEDERLLNTSLTLFDEVCFLQTQKLFHKSDDTWEYIASELQYLAANKSVWDYWAYRVHEGLKAGFPNNIIPFTGFSQLYKTIPDKFKAEPFPKVPKKHRALFYRVTST
jgi:hypothetical protein